MHQFKLFLYTINAFLLLCFFFVNRNNHTSIDFLGWHWDKIPISILAIGFFMLGSVVVYVLKFLSNSSTKK